MSNQCHQCGSYAINHQHHGRDGSEPDLCDVCFWHSRHDQLKAELDRLRDVQILLNTERALVEQLEERLDEARELLAVASEIIHEQAIHIDRPMTDLGSEALTRLDDWMEENKI